MALLDALIELLDDDGQSEDDDSLVPVVGDDRPADPPPPRPGAPGARQQAAANHCQFCQTNCDYRNFENHLRTSPMCLSRYQRRLSVRTLESVLVLSHYCLFCPSKGPQKLHYHLEQNSSCLNQFCERFEINSEDSDCIRRVTKKVGMLKKEGYPSRTPNYRKKENLKVIEQRLGTMEDALNQFRNKTTYGNIFKCVLCTCFKVSSEVVEVDDIEAINVVSVENLESLNASKRNGKFWKCIGCENTSSYQFPEDGNVKFSVQDTADSTIFTPILNNDNNECEPEQDDVVLPSQPPDKLIKVFLPSSIESLQSYGDVSAKTQKDMDLLLYRGSSFLGPELKVIFLNQLSKFKSAKINSDLFFAKIHPGEEKKLSSVKLQTNQSHIQGSEMWKVARQSDRSSMMMYLGPLCIQLEIKVPLDSEGVIASCLIQEGHAVTASSESTESHEMCTVYYVHEGHSSSEPCHSQCLKVPLRDFLRDNSFGPNKIHNSFAPVYICSISQKMNSLVSDLLRCSSNPLSSTEYHFQLSFCPSGEAVIKGLLWPDIVKQLNLDLMGKTEKEEQRSRIQKFIEDIDKTIATTSSPKILQSQFGLSDQDLANLLPDIESNQVQVGEDNKLSQDPFLPSQMTILQMVPEKIENYQSSRSLLRLVHQFLLNLTEDERDTMSTQEFLEKFWEEEVEEAEQVENGIWRIATINQTLYFAAEDKFTEIVTQFDGFPMAGLYHFALSCAISIEERKIILKRLQVKDCYTLPYNVMIMKAFKCQTIVEPVSGHFNWYLETMNQEGPDQDMVLEIPFHTKTPLTEAISLSDKKIVVKASRSFVFVSSGPERLLPVKKVDTWSEECYTIDGIDSIYFEEQRNMITRFFCRQNGKLLLSEFATNYQYPGEEKAVKLSNLYRGKLDEIPISAEKSSVVDDEPFPDFIVTGDDDVMVLRKASKILKTSAFDQDSYEEKFSTVLLYYFPLNSIDDLTEEAVNRLFDERCPDDPSFSKVSRNRAEFIKKYRNVV